MKIRSGFVSNSSSSSFIVGIGLVRPGKESEVEKIFNEHQIFSVVETVCDDTRGKYAEPKVVNGGNVIEYESPNYHTIQLTDIYKEMERLGVDDLKFVFFDGTGDEPEYDEDCGNYDTEGFDDPDSGYYDEKDVRRFKAVNNRELFLQGESTCGGGYYG